MYSQTKEPQQRLADNAVKIWWISAVISNVIGFVIFGVLLFLNFYFSWYAWIGWVLIGLTIILVLFAVWDILIRPKLLYAHWRYDVSEQFLQMKFGTLTEVHQLIPMTKIQSVATRQGPLLRKYKLYALSVDTMGSSHSIPILPEQVALDLRDQIAYYAKIKEVDE
ncbi:PH domain-containing protein [Paenibacillus sp. 453mf]|uniref:PH domain-containing protein n=1 Tax=Paenibacillus sp. 453mf TaxID=1761874 RepID=UPI001FCD4474|nr:PH domain-containing protein [Paenibacillus sp. 453mf]